MLSTDLILRYEGRRAVESGHLERLRVCAKLSQSELARALGVTSACVSRWESGQRLPRGQGAERLARLLRELENAVG